MKCIQRLSSPKLKIMPGINSVISPHFVDDLTSNFVFRYYFKSTRQSSERNDAPRRFVLQPGVLPEEARLPAVLGRLRICAAAYDRWEEGGHSGIPPQADFADVRLRVGGRLFRWVPEIKRQSLGCTDLDDQ